MIYSIKNTIYDIQNTLYENIKFYAKANPSHRP